MKLSNTLGNKIVTEYGEVKDIPYSWMNELAEDIKRWRKNEAAIVDLPAFCVFDDKVLFAIINVLPRTINDLWLVPGLNKVRIDSYGVHICHIVSSFLEKKGIVDILYGKSAFDLSSKKTVGILGYLGVLDYFITDKNDIEMME